MTRLRKINRSLNEQYKFEMVDKVRNGVGADSGG